MSITNYSDGVTMAMGESSDSTGDPVSLKQLSTSLISTEFFVLLRGGATT